MECMKKVLAHGGIAFLFLLCVMVANTLKAPEVDFKKIQDINYEQGKEAQYKEALEKQLETHSLEDLHRVMELKAFEEAQQNLKNTFIKIFDEKVTNEAKGRPENLVKIMTTNDAFRNSVLKRLTEEKNIDALLKIKAAGNTEFKKAMRDRLIDIAQDKTLDSSVLLNLLADEDVIRFLSISGFLSDLKEQKMRKELEHKVFENVKTAIQKNKDYKKKQLEVFETANKLYKEIPVVFYTLRADPFFDSINEALENLKSKKLEDQELSLVLETVLLPKGGMPDLLSIKMTDFLKEQFKNNKNVPSLVMQTFEKSKAPKTTWQFWNYLAFLEPFVSDPNVKKFAEKLIEPMITSLEKTYTEKPDDFNKSLSILSDTYDRAKAFGKEKLVISEIVKLAKENKWGLEYFKDKFIYDYRKVAFAQILLEILPSEFKIASDALPWLNEIIKLEPAVKGNPELAKALQEKRTAILDFIIDTIKKSKSPVLEKKPENIDASAIVDALILRMETTGRISSKVIADILKIKPSEPQIGKILTILSKPGFAEFIKKDLKENQAKPVFDLMNNAKTRLSPEKSQGLIVPLVRVMYANGEITLRVQDFLVKNYLDSEKDFKKKLTALDIFKGDQKDQKELNEFIEARYKELKHDEVLRVLVSSPEEMKKLLGVIPVDDALSILSSDDIEKLESEVYPKNFLEIVKKSSNIELLKKILPMTRERLLLHTAINNRLADLAKEQKPEQVLKKFAELSLKEKFAKIETMTDIKDFTPEIVDDLRLLNLESVFNALDSNVIKQAQKGTAIYELIVDALKLKRSWDLADMKKNGEITAEQFNGVADWFMKSIERILKAVSDDETIRKDIQEYYTDADWLERADKMADILIGLARSRKWISSLDKLKDMLPRPETQARVILKIVSSDDFKVRGTEIIPWIEALNDCAKETSVQLDGDLIADLTHRQIMLLNELTVNDYRTMGSNNAERIQKLGIEITSRLEKMPDRLKKIFGKYAVLAFDSAVSILSATYKATKLRKEELSFQWSPWIRLFNWLAGRFSEAEYIEAFRHASVEEVEDLLGAIIGDLENKKRYLETVPRAPETTAKLREINKLLPQVSDAKKNIKNIMQKMAGK